MNPNYYHTITLYNRIKASDSPDKKDYWQRTVLENCFWKAVTNTVIGTEASVQNTYTVRIPEDDRYLPYAAFCQDPDGHFTASAGDLVVYGTCEDEITGESGHTAAQVLNRYKPNAFKVTAFSDNTLYPFGKHYRLGG